MLAQKTYWIQNKMSRSFTSMDPEECAALVAIMRSHAKFCGINILTYQLESGRLSMLVSCPVREHHLKFFEDAEGEPAGSGEKRLLAHLQNHYSKAHLEELKDEIEALKQQGEDAQPLLEHYTRRIGLPKKYAEGINEAFTRWVRKHRRHIYDKLEGNVCRKGITQTYVEQLLKQRDLAMLMDRDAVRYDDGQEPREFWCGFADALRGDEDALDGLRELMRSHAHSAQDIKDLGYCQKRGSSEARKPQLQVAAARMSKSSAQILSGAHLYGPEYESSHSDYTPEEKAPYQLSGTLIKLGLFCIILSALGGIALIIGKEQLDRRAEHSKGTREYKPLLPHQAQLLATKSEADKLDEVKNLLYTHEARQLAVDFAKSSDVDARLSMCRYPEKIKERLPSYPAQAVNEPAADVIFTDVVDIGVITAARFYIKFKDETTRMLCIVPTLDGLRVDWDCYARYNTQAWPELLKGAVQSAELRVFAKRSDYHAFGYRDDTQWSCFELISPDFEQPLYAYSARGTTTSKLLETAMPKSGSNKKVQLTLKISSVNDGHKHRQFTIDRIHAFGWVRGEKDIEDSYRQRIHEISKVEQDS